VVHRVLDHFEAVVDLVVHDYMKDHGSDEASEANLDWWSLLESQVVVLDVINQDEE